MSITLQLFVAFWYINNVFDSKHVVFDTKIITSKSPQFKSKLRKLRETGPYSGSYAEFWIGRYPVLPPRILTFSLSKIFCRIKIYEHFGFILEVNM